MSASPAQRLPVLTDLTLRRRDTEVSDEKLLTEPDEHRSTSASEKWRADLCRKMTITSEEVSDSCSSRRRSCTPRRDRRAPCTSSSKLPQQFHARCASSPGFGPVVRPAEES